jgi:hypothetical protein
MDQALKSPKIWKPASIWFPASCSFIITITHVSSFSFRLPSLPHIYPRIPSYLRSV